MLRQTGQMDVRFVGVGIALLGACTYVPPTAYTDATTGGFGGAGAGESVSSSGTTSGGLGGASTGGQGVGTSTSSSSGTGSGSSSSSTGSSSSSSSSSSGGVLVPPAFVQIAFTTPQTKEFKATATYMKGQTAGNTNILAIGWNDTTSVLLTVADSMGNSYVPATGLSASATMSQIIYYAPNIVAAPAGTNSVTVSFNAAAEYIDLRVVEYAGLSGLDPVGANTAKAGNGTFATTDTMTTTTPFTLLFSAGMTRGSFSGPGAGYALRVITSPDADIVQDRIAPSPTVAKATAPLSNSEWLMQLVAFNAGP